MWYVYCMVGFSILVGVFVVAAAMCSSEADRRADAIEKKWAEWKKERGIR